MKHLVRSLALFTSLALFSTGCFGSFPITHKVYDFNASVGGKFVQTLVFWVFIIIPVYGVATLIDAVIFNLIDFWAGGNSTRVEALPDGSERVTTRVSAELLRIETFRDGKVIDTIELQKVGNSAGIARRNGVVVVSGEMLRDGGFAISDASGTRQISAELVGELSTRARTGGLVAAIAAQQDCGQLAAR